MTANVDISNCLCLLFPIPLYRMLRNGINRKRPIHISIYQAYINEEKFRILFILKGSVSLSVSEASSLKPVDLR